MESYALEGRPEGESWDNGRTGGAVMSEHGADRWSGTGVLFQVFVFNDVFMSRCIYTPGTSMHDIWIMECSIINQAMKNRTQKLGFSIFHLSSPLPVLSC